jgi:hypothetical protein
MFKVVIFLVVTLFSSFSLSQEYNPFFKIGLGYVLDQPTSIKIDDPENGKFDQALYTGSNDSQTYTLETGIQTQGCVFGLMYTNIINQSSESRYIHNPERFEVFGYKQYPFIGNTSFIMGTGLLVKYDNTIQVSNNEGNFTYRVTEEFSWLERITARLGVVYQHGDYEIGLIHHSQWLTGKPFSDKFENQKTEILISYYF